MSAAVLLIDPHFPHNVGNALRACALLGAGTLYWTGSRVPPPDRWPEGARLPREERMKCYRNTQLRHLAESSLARSPEDGDVPKGIRHACHRFVRIPAADPQERTPYNLAFSVGAVLYDRLYKVTRPTFEMARAGGGAA
jgi:tRNA(Leu) C34 or U34 (ribose-2'-O)-methylase TrmL